jgi:hypothetical protein
VCVCVCGRGGGAQGRRDERVRVRATGCLSQCDCVGERLCPCRARG